MLYCSSECWNPIQPRNSTNINETPCKYKFMSKIAFQCLFHSLCCVMFVPVPLPVGSSPNCRSNYCLWCWHLCWQLLLNKQLNWLGIKPGIKQVTRHSGKVFAKHWMCSFCISFSAVSSHMSCAASCTCIFLQMSYSAKHMNGKRC